MRQIVSIVYPAACIGMVKLQLCKGNEKKRQRQHCPKRLSQKGNGFADSHSVNFGKFKEPS